MVAKVARVLKQTNKNLWFYDVSKTEQDDQQLPEFMEGVLNTQLIAAMISRDKVLHEVRECILTRMHPKQVQAIQRTDTHQMKEPQC